MLETTTNQIYDRCNCNATVPGVGNLMIFEVEVCPEAVAFDFSC
jgi:hypothetical protein